MLDLIYIIHIEDHKNETGSTSWFWSRDEAERVYDVGSDYEDTTMTLYSASVNGLIQDFVDEAIGNGAEGLNEIRSNRPAPESLGSWTELEYRPEGYFYIERLKASTSEYWPYRAEILDTPEHGFVLIDHTSDQKIATIEPVGYAFRVTVNDVVHDKPFHNLKGAVIYAAEEYNGV